jgi:hypothetical protein
MRFSSLASPGLGLMARISSLLSTLVVLVSFTHYLGLEERGLAFSALAIAGAIGFFDLGVSIGGVRRIAAKTAGLSHATRLDTKWGGRRCFVKVRGLLKFLLIWQVVAATFYIVFMFVAAALFNVDGYAHHVSWYQIYAFLCALSFLTTPLPVLMEGLGRVEFVYAVRAISDIAFSVFLVVAFLSGCGLLSIVVAQGGRLMAQVLGYLAPLRRIIVPIVRLPVSKEIRAENIFAGQGREFHLMLAATWVVGYFVAQVTVPALNRFAGSEMAGSYGSLFFLVSGLASLGLIHPLMKFSQNTRDHARGNDSAVRQNYVISAASSCAVYLLGAAATVAFVVVGVIPESLAETSLAKIEIALVFWIGFCQMNFGVVASYFRVLGTERFFSGNIVLAMMNIIGLVFITRPGDIFQYLTLIAVVYGAACILQFRVFWRAIASG